MVVLETGSVVQAGLELVAIVLQRQNAEITIGMSQALLAGHVSTTVGTCVILQ